MTRLVEIFTVILIVILTVILTKWLPSPLATAVGKQVLVLLSASVERFDVSRKRDFLKGKVKVFVKVIFFFTSEIGFFGLTWRVMLL